jgi:hypothetical protein
MTELRIENWELRIEDETRASILNSQFSILNSSRDEVAR